MAKISRQRHFSYIALTGLVCLLVFGAWLYGSMYYLTSYPVLRGSMMVVSVWFVSGGLYWLVAGLLSILFRYALFGGSTAFFVVIPVTFGGHAAILRHLPEAACSGGLVVHICLGLGLAFSSCFFGAACDVQNEEQDVYTEEEEG